MTNKTKFFFIFPLDKKILKRPLLLGVDAYLESWMTILVLRRSYIGVGCLYIRVGRLCLFFKEKLTFLFFDAHISEMDTHISESDAYMHYL